MRSKSSVLSSHLVKLVFHENRILFRIKASLPHYPISHRAYALGGPLSVGLTVVDHFLKPVLPRHPGASERVIPYEAQRVEPLDAVGSEDPRPFRGLPGANLLRLLALRPEETPFFPEALDPQRKLERQARLG